MRILSYNPGHDGAIAHVEDARLVASLESEKNSNYRHSSLAIHDVFDALGDLNELPDVICAGGWWRRDHYEYLHGSNINAGYRGLATTDVILDERHFLGKAIKYFSSSHERSHILCAFGMSDLPMGTPCYALVWEGEIGSFYQIDSKLNIQLVGDVLNQPGNRYSQLYGLADPTFPKDGEFPRPTDAGKLMALASFSVRSTATADEKKLLAFLLNGTRKPFSAYDGIAQSPHYNVGLDDKEFRNFAGIFSDKMFDVFYRFAEAHLEKGLPLVVAGGCGLNCDWNTKWAQCGLFPDVFVPPVANDSGAAIGTAIDAQFHLTGNAKLDWNVYCGLTFAGSDTFDTTPYDAYETNYRHVADLLAENLILGWVSGKCEIGPRALGNRSLLAAPFSTETRVKQREQFRPIAPVCLEQDAATWFGCNHESPFMLFTHRARTEVLAAVTHVNGTARLQTVSNESNQPLFALLSAFKERTGYGVLCNTSLNFKGKGFINNITDLSRYALAHDLDGFVVNQTTYLVNASARYQAYRRKVDSSAPSA